MAKLEVATAGESLPPIIEELEGKLEEIQAIRDEKLFGLYIDLEAIIDELIISEQDSEIIEKVEATKRKLEFIYGVPLSEAEGAVSGAIGTLIGAYEAKLGLEEAIADAMGALEYAKGVLHFVIGGPVRLLEYVLEEVEGTIANLQGVIAELEGVEVYTELPPIIAELIYKYHSLGGLTYACMQTRYCLEEFEAPPEVLEKLDDIIDELFDIEGDLDNAIGTLIDAYIGESVGPDLEEAIGEAIDCVKGFLHEVVPEILDAIAELQRIDPLVPFLKDALAELEEVIAELG